MKSISYRINQVLIPVSKAEVDFSLVLSQKLKISQDSFHDIRVVRKSLDSRKKGRLNWKFNLEFKCSATVSGQDVHRAGEEVPEEPEDSGFISLPEKVHVIGCGPAGMFTALGLAEKGYDVHVYEQGKQVGRRAGDIRAFMVHGTVNPSSNIVCGEGGAGTFSDGKLTSRTSSRHSRRVMDVLVQCGADASIRYLAKPHLGSDRLPLIVTSMRKHLESLGVMFHFDTRVSHIEIEGCHVRHIHIGNTKIPVEALVLASGHSSRLLLRSLHSQGTAMEPKGFAAGVRIEHPQKFINHAQLGRNADTSLVGNAEYLLTCNMGDVRAYTFCMCPGGEIMPCADEEGGIFTNGMSRMRRNSPFANAAIVVPVGPEDFGNDPLSGIGFQEALERHAFSISSDYGFPAQTSRSFSIGREDTAFPGTSFQKKLVPVDFSGFFGGRISASLRKGLESFDRKIPGFIERGLMIGPETRTSSPVRILRDGRTMESISTQGLFPVGEGAGYAGGIVSSASDGLRFASLAKECRHAG